MKKTYLTPALERVHFEGTLLNPASPVLDSSLGGTEGNENFSRGKEGSIWESEEKESSLW